MLSLTIRQLEYVVGIARHGSVSSAATALNVSQPALSVALAQLEGQLGKTLFLRRSGARVTPTSFGRSFLPEAEALLEAAGHLVRRSSSSPLSPVTLGIFEDLAPLMLGPILAALNREHPQIVVRHFANDFDDLAAALRSGEADLAITYDLGLDRSFLRQELARLPLQAVVHADHPFAARDDLLLRDVAGEKLILAERGLSRSHMLSVFARHGLSVKVGHNAQSLETMRSLAANGLGVGLSYTRPKPGMSHDGRTLHHVVISDADAAEPIVLVHYEHNMLSETALAVSHVISSLDFDL